MKKQYLKRVEGAVRILIYIVFTATLFSVLYIGEKDAMYFGKKEKAICFALMQIVVISQLITGIRYFIKPIKILSKIAVVFTILSSVSVLAIFLLVKLVYNLNTGYTSWQYIYMVGVVLVFTYLLGSDIGLLFKQKQR